MNENNQNTETAPDNYPKIDPKRSLEIYNLGVNTSPNQQGHIDRRGRIRCELSIGENHELVFGKPLPGFDPVTATISNAAWDGRPIGATALEILPSPEALDAAQEIVKKAMAAGQLLIRYGEFGLPTLKEYDGVHHKLQHRYYDKQFTYREKTPTKFTDLSGREQLVFHIFELLARVAPTDTRFDEALADHINHGFLFSSFDLMLGFLIHSSPLEVATIKRLKSDYYHHPRQFLESDRDIDDVIPYLIESASGRRWEVGYLLVKDFPRHTHNIGMVHTPKFVKRVITRTVFDQTPRDVVIGMYLDTDYSYGIQQGFAKRGEPFHGRADWDDVRQGPFGPGETKLKFSIVAHPESTWAIGPFLGGPPPDYTIDVRRRINIYGAVAADADPNCMAAGYGAVSGTYADGSISIGIEAKTSYGSSVAIGAVAVAQATPLSFNDFYLPAVIAEPPSAWFKDPHTDPRVRNREEFSQARWEAEAKARAEGLLGEYEDAGDRFLPPPFPPRPLMPWTVLPVSHENDFNRLPLRSHGGHTHNNAIGYGSRATNSAPSIPFISEFHTQPNKEYERLAALHGKNYHVNPHDERRLDPEIQFEYAGFETERNKLFKHWWSSQSYLSDSMRSKGRVDVWYYMSYEDAGKVFSFPKLHLGYEGVYLPEYDGPQPEWVVHRDLFAGYVARAWGEHTLALLADPRYLAGQKAAVALMGMEVKYSEIQAEVQTALDAGDVSEEFRDKVAEFLLSVENTKRLASCCTHDAFVYAGLINAADEVHRAWGYEYTPEIERLANLKNLIGTVTPRTGSHSGFAPPSTAVGSLTTGNNGGSAFGYHASAGGSESIAIGNFANAVGGVSIGAYSKANPGGIMLGARPRNLFLNNKIAENSIPNAPVRGETRPNDSGINRQVRGRNTSGYAHYGDILIGNDFVSNITPYWKVGDKVIIDSPNQKLGMNAPYTELTKFFGRDGSLQSMHLGESHIRVKSWAVEALVVPHEEKQFSTHFQNPDDRYFKPEEVPLTPFRVSIGDSIINDTLLSTTIGAYSTALESSVGGSAIGFGSVVGGERGVGLGAYATSRQDGEVAIGGSKWSCKRNLSISWRSDPAEDSRFTADTGVPLTLIPSKAKTFEDEFTVVAGVDGYRHNGAAKVTGTITIQPFDRACKAKDACIIDVEYRIWIDDIDGSVELLGTPTINEQHRGADAPVFTFTIGDDGVPRIETTAPKILARGLIEIVDLQSYRPELPDRLQSQARATYWEKHIAPHMKYWNEGKTAIRAILAENVTDEINTLSAALEAERTRLNAIPEYVRLKALRVRHDELQELIYRSPLYADPDPEWLVMDAARRREVYGPLIDQRDEFLSRYTTATVGMLNTMKSVRDRQFAAIIGLKPYIEMLQGQPARDEDLIQFIDNPIEHLQKMVTYIESNKPNIGWLQKHASVEHMITTFTEMLGEDNITGYEDFIHELLDTYQGIRTYELQLDEVLLEVSLFKDTLRAAEDQYYEIHGEEIRAVETQPHPERLRFQQELDSMIGVDYYEFWQQFNALHEYEPELQRLQWELLNLEYRANSAKDRIDGYLRNMLDTIGKAKQFLPTYNAFNGSSDYPDVIKFNVPEAVTADDLIAGRVVL